MDSGRIGKLLIALLLAGCSTISHEPPPRDWPELRVVVHKHGFMQNRECDGFIGGCAAPRFCVKRCDIYLQFDIAAIETHERQHCAGYDHPNDWKPMATAWESYKRFGRHECRFRLGTERYCKTWPEDLELCQR